MPRIGFHILIAVLVSSTGPAPAEARLSLAEEPHINEQLIAAAAGDMLRKTCPTLSARFLVVWQKLRDLEKYARDQGFTEEEVDAFLKDKEQRARVKAAATSYLAEAGVIEGDVGSYCMAGRAEIDKGTLVGSLLRSSE